MRVIVSAVDAGGGANLAPVAALVSPEQRRVFCSAASEGYFHRCGVDEVVRWDPSLSVEAEISRWRPGAVICGTTRYESPDRLFVSAARNAGVRSVVVLDEWYRYAERFRNASGSLSYVPDAICVPDELARHEAIVDGLPEDRLVTTGSPALTNLCDRLDEYVMSPPPVPSAFEGAPHPWIVYLSENHAEDFGRTDSGGPLGPYLGYTEETVAAELGRTIAGIGLPCTVVEKAHPSSATTSHSPALGPNQTWRRVGRVALEPLFWHADLVVGMRSMALLEAVLTGVPTVAFQPGLRAPYGPSTVERLGLADRAADGDDLRRWLSDRWSRTQRRQVSRPPFAQSGSANRVREVLTSESRETTR